MEVNFEVTSTSSYLFNYNNYYLKYIIQFIQILKKIII
jgi:hypothetical protein